jgi:ABC-type lipoprotein export system ATPase subunit
MPRGEIMNKPVIKAKNLTKIYNPGQPNEVAALKDATLEIHAGESVIIEGPSGSGKSTLLSLLGVLDRPSQGQVLIDDEAVERLSDFWMSKLRREKIGFIYQRFNLIAGLKAWENVGYPLIPVGVPRKERRERSCALLERLGIGHRVEHSVEEISGGEAQRVSIARALINSPQIIFADEPSSNIDLATMEGVLEIFNELRDEGKTMVLSTNDPFMSDFGKKTITLRDGRLEDIVEK